MVEQPCVSIVITAYNAKRFIGKALDSCLAQTYTDYEIIVVDDGSTDGTSDFIRQHYAETVHLITQPNKGIGIARNAGIDAARGQFIKFLDADDTIHPTHLAAVMQRFSAVDEQVALVYTRYNNIIETRIEPHTQRIPEGDIFCDILLNIFEALVLPSACTARKTALYAVGLFPDDEEWRYSDDLDTWLRLANDYHFAAVDEFLMNRLIHDTSDSADTDKMFWRIMNTLIKARDYPKRQKCMTDEAYETFVADKAHGLAMKAWRRGKIEQARDFLDIASDVTSQSQQLRRVYKWLTYFAPYAVVTTINNIIKRIHPTTS